MKKALMYGAGNIGRGFIGKVFADSGYTVCFLDIEAHILRAFDEQGRYDVQIVSDDGIETAAVENVYAANANSCEALYEIAHCDIMATAVGVNVLPRIAPTIARGIALRMQSGLGALNIILAENQLHVGKLMREWIYETLTERERAWADANLGLVEASIGRMIPPLAPEQRARNPLLIAVEPYAELPVDKDGFKGDPPDLVGLLPFSPFDFYIKRKLYLHNMGHAICAYLGYEKGYAYIWQAIRDPDIKNAVENAMQAVVTALGREYHTVDLREIERNKADLLHRFRNKGLQDTVARVAHDPIRKLRRDDRLLGAALYCMEQGIDPSCIVLGIASALRYNSPEDEAACKLQAALREQGIVYALGEYMGLTAQSHLGALIIDALCAAKKS